jgi:hypothetical protein
MDLPTLSKPPAFALNLTRLPRELVVKVIDELPLVKILQVLSHKNQYLDGCVLNSLKWNGFFRSSADISSVCIFLESLYPNFDVSWALRHWLFTPTLLSHE